MVHLLAVALAAASLLAFAPAARAASPAEGLPPGEARELVAGLCDACHSIGMVKQQGLSRGLWERSLKVMVEERGMTQLNPSEYALVLDYLAKWFGPDRAAARR